MSGDGFFVSGFVSTEISHPAIPGDITVPYALGGPNLGSGFIVFGGKSPSIAAALTIDTVDVVVTPLPAALPLFATGLGVMGWFARRRRGMK